MATYARATSGAFVAGALDRLGDDLDQRHAGPVVVEQRVVGAVDPAGGATDVQRLAGVLLHVRALDLDPVRLARRPSTSRSSPRTRSARRTARSGSSSACPGRSSSSGRTGTTRAIAQFSASPIRIADSIAFALTTGIEPGRPRQTGQVWVFGSAPNSVGQPQNIFVLRAQLDVHLEPEDRVEPRDRLVVRQQARSSARSIRGRDATVQREMPGRAAGRPSSCTQLALQRGADPVEPVVGQRRRHDLQADRQAVLGGQPDRDRAPALPARLDGMVHRSLRYIAIGSSTFSPSRNAVIGVDGETSTSTWANAASKSRLISVRTFCA